MDEDGLIVIDELLQQEIDELLTDEFLFIKDVKDEKEISQEELDSKKSKELFLLNESN